MQIDTQKWSGEGTFTQVVLDRLKVVDQIAGLNVEDAPASRSEADYNFISNEIFVAFALVGHVEPTRRLGIFPATRRDVEKAMTLGGLQSLLEVAEGLG